MCAQKLEERRVFCLPPGERPPRISCFTTRRATIYIYTNTNTTIISTTAHARRRQAAQAQQACARRSVQRKTQTARMSHDDDGARRRCSKHRVAEMPAPRLFTWPGFARSRRTSTPLGPGEVRIPSRAQRLFGGAFRFVEAGPCRIDTK